MERENVICIKEADLERLIDKVVGYIKKVHGLKQDIWVNDKNAMDLLGISSKTTLQRLRDQGKIKFTQPMKKVILYNRESINNYLNNHIRETF